MVRLLGESLANSVTSVARDVVSKEAESICNSVNSMLKTLNGQLMHSVDEVHQFESLDRICCCYRCESPALLLATNPET